MKKAVKIILGVFAGLIILGVIASIASPSDPASVSKTDSSGGEQKTAQTEFKAGDIINFDGKNVTVSPAQRHWDSGNQFITPQSGSEFIKVQVTIENNSDEEVSYNTYDWKMQDSKGVIKDASSAVYSVDGALNSGELAPNGKISGFLIFEVPDNDSGLTLRYEPSFWSDKKIEIKL